MRTLVIVISHPGAQGIVDANADTWFRAGSDVMGVEHQDKPAMCWPKGSLPVLRMGTDHGREPGGLTGRIARIMSWCLSTSYEQFCFMESDAILTKPVPELNPRAIMGTLAGHRSSGFHGANYWHCPWVISAEMLPPILNLSQRMIRTGLVEHGMPDRFFGLLSDLYPEFAFTDSGNYSRNTIYEADVTSAREHIKKPNCFAVHGVKTRAILKLLTQP